MKSQSLLRNGFLATFGFFAFALGASLMSSPARAADVLWTNLAGGEFLNPFNWSPTGVPGAADNANFNVGIPAVTWAGSRTNANAFFNPVNGSVAQFIGTNFWLLTQSYVLGQNAGSTSAVVHFTGELRVTNGAGTGRLVIGQNGRGTYQLFGVNASVVADRLFVTNNTVGATNSILLLSFGTLTTLYGSTIAPLPNSFSIGSTVGGTATWNILGGTNVVVGTTTLGKLPGTRGVVTVAGAGTLWSNAVGLAVGGFGTNNLLVISNGASVFGGIGVITGDVVGATNNEIQVIGPNARLETSVNLHTGYGGAGNRLTISGGGMVVASGGGFVGFGGTASNNTALVTGSGSLWSNASSLFLGQSGSGNALIVSNNATVIAFNVSIGSVAGALSNVLTVADGNLLGTVANSGEIYSLQVGEGGQGTLNLNSGIIRAKSLTVTNGLSSVMNFNDGLLNVRAMQVNNSQIFFVGKGVLFASMNVIGGGTNFFANGLTVRNKGTLGGNGTINGIVTVQPGGGLAPGESGIGRLVLNNPPVLQGGTYLELGNFPLLTNDQVRVVGAVSYGGSLSVSMHGPDTLSLGSRFPLFSASSYGGAFSSVGMPSPLAAGLTWTNKLLVDGSVEVVARGPLRFGKITRAGTDVILNGGGGAPNASYAVLTSTNVTSPVTNWIALATNQFDGFGDFSFTNAISSAIPRRFYLLRFP